MFADVLGLGQIGQGIQVQREVGEQMFDTHAE